MMRRAEGIVMSRDIVLWLPFVLKIAVTASLVVACSVIAERAGAVIAALVVTLPITAGPSYVFLALDHGASFVAGAALGGLVMIAVNAVFLLVYAAVAQRHRAAGTFAAAFAAWIALALLAGSVSWTFGGAIALSAATFLICVPLAERFGHCIAPSVKHYWYDVPLRVLLVCSLVGTVVGLSRMLGPVLSGSLAMFPVALSSLGLILHPRIGGPAAAAVMANSIPASAGFATALVLLHLTAVPLGSAPALCLTLLVSVGWNMALLGLRRRGALVSARG
jgi:hypothetical protein